MRKLTVTRTRLFAGAASIGLAGLLPAISRATIPALYDPSFELEAPGTIFPDDGATNGVWSSFGDKYTITASNAHTGNNSVETSDGGLYQFLISNVGDGSDLYGQTVAYSFWVVDPNAGPETVNYHFDARDTATNVYSAAVDGTIVGSNVPTETHFFGTFNVPTSATTVPNALVVQIAGATGAFYFDDFSLAVVPRVVGESQWNVATAGDWNNGANWTNGVPNGAGTEADFAGTISASHTVFTDVPVTVGTVTFNNSSASYVIAGAGSLTIQGNGSNGAIDVYAGSHSITLPLIVATNSTFNVASGSSLTIGGPLTVDAGVSLNQSGGGSVIYQNGITLMNGSSIAFASGASANSLKLVAKSTASVATSIAGSPNLIQLSALSFSGSTAAFQGTLDLSNNAMVVHGGSLSAVTSAVAAGYNATGVLWTGPGIDSSAAAADTTHLTALGVIANSLNGSTPLYGSGDRLGLFDGTSPAASDILVRYTYYGDANLNGKVDSTDYALIDNGYLGHLTGWINGDFNYDGIVNGSDYTLIDNAFNTQGASLASEVASSTSQIAGGGIAAVPEPATFSAVVLLGLGMLGNRRRRH
jgi:hypothetical protein